jgi:hypothetical protein
LLLADKTSLLCKSPGRADLEGRWRAGGGGRLLGLLPALILLAAGLGAWLARRVRLRHTAMVPGRGAGQAPA